MATTFYAFRVPVTTSGTPVQLDTFSVEPDQTVLVKAKSTNTGVISVGNSSAEALKSNAENFLLSAGQSVELKVPNTNEIWIDSTISGDIVEVVVGGGAGSGGGSGSSASQVQGNIANGATDSGNPVKTGGKYNSSAPTLTDGQRGDTQVDVNGNTKTTLATTIAGEDITNDVMKVEQRFSYATITTATTTTIKSGAGFVKAINILGGTAGAITVYDNIAGSGATIWPTFTPGSVSVPVPMPIDVSFSTGLTIVTAAATIIQVSYR